MPKTAIVGTTMIIDKILQGLKVPTRSKSKLGSSRIGQAAIFGADS